MSLDSIVAAIGEPYFRDDAVAIYHADCRDILPKIPKVDLVLTDPQFFLPPIGHGARGDQEWHGSLGDLAMFEATFEPFFEHFKRLLGRGGQLYVNCHYRSYPSLYKLAYTRWPKVDMIVWYKPTGRVGRGWRHAHELVLHASGKDTIYADGFRLNIVGIMPVRTMKRAHPAEKPGEIGDFLLEAVQGPGVMLDPFMGSGSYLVAAKKRGLRAIGIEIEEKYCEIAAKRMAQGVLL
jgi:site-specific DNA-methyltransferase (adenine-specific)